jgi:acetyl esterase/lipase
MSEPLAGAILISPWTKFATDDESVKRNQNSDIVTPAAAKRWSSLFLGITPLSDFAIVALLTYDSGPSKIDSYNQSVIADSAWFKGLDGKVKDILVWGGGGEVLIDSIEVTAKKLQQAHPRVEYVVQNSAAHDDFIIEKILGYKNKGEGTEVIERWMKARL